MCIGDEMLAEKNLQKSKEQLGKFQASKKFRAAGNAVRIE